MNASKLKTILKKILDAEEKFRTQEISRNLSQHLANLASQPSNLDLQIQYTDNFRKFSTILNNFRDQFSPVDLKNMETIGINLSLMMEIPSKITKWVSENPATLTVAVSKIEEIIIEREEIFARISQAFDGIDFFDLDEEYINEGEAEIGFLLPRELFNNNLEKLIKELSIVNQIIRVFSEVSNGKVEEVEIHSISTSDPIFFFGISAGTIIAIGKTITWGLDTWKKIEEIRKIRAETREKIGQKAVDAVSAFDKLIKDTIDSAIESKVQDVMSMVQAEHTRRSEIEIHLKWAIESLLARIERGLTIEIRAIPKAESVDNSTELDEKAAGDFEELTSVIIPQLAFQPPQKAPLMQLPPEKPKEKK